MVDSTDGSVDTTDVQQKLHVMETDWQNVVELAEQQRSLIDSRLALWQDYRQSLDRLSQMLDEVNQSIDENPVPLCDTEQAKHLLDLYRVRRLVLRNNSVNFVPSAILRKIQV